MEEVKSYNNNIIAVGWHSSIVVSDDARKTWKQLVINTDKSFRTVKIIDHNTTWIAGEDGLLIKTNDHYKSWKDLHFFNHDDINSIETPDDGKTIFIGTTSGKLFRIDSSGATWENIIIPSLDKKGISQIYWNASQQELWMVGRKG